MKRTGFFGLHSSGRTHILPSAPAVQSPRNCTVFMEVSMKTFEVEDDPASSATWLPLKSVKKLGFPLSGTSAMAITRF